MKPQSYFILQWGMWVNCHLAGLGIDITNVWSPECGFLIFFRKKFCRKEHDLIHLRPLCKRALLKTKFWAEFNQLFCQLLTALALTKFWGKKPKNFCQRFWHNQSSAYLCRPLEKAGLEKLKNRPNGAWRIADGRRCYSHCKRAKITPQQVHWHGGRGKEKRGRPA